MLIALASVCHNASGQSGSALLPQEVVAFDNTKITKSCRLILPSRPVADEDGNGVIHIEGDDITVDFEGRMLMGADPAARQETLTGIGIRVTGKRVTLKNGALSGYKVGIAGSGCDGARVTEFFFLHMYAQRLKSTPEEEHADDWLWPHNNDADQWANRYGAAISIRSASDIELSRVKVRQSQNGILLANIKGSRVLDCDASFLSGWGIALWRCTENTVARNAFDFCVRGYSHERYNRGQDSAGILMFEQCSDNTVMLNSATHCGDGLFMFAGNEALGDAPDRPTAANAALTSGLGCNRNLIACNDFSDAAAHGIETTFSFGNRLLFNRLDRCAICGVWGGYSRNLLVHGNVVRANGMPGQTEGGGINIEHGIGCVIERNFFSSNTVGVSLWWDEDPALAAKPWCASNGAASADNSVVYNKFTDDAVALRLRDTMRTLWANNILNSVARAIDADEASTSSIVENEDARPVLDLSPLVDQCLALTRPAMPVTLDGLIPTSTRNQLSGRAAIAMGEYGPYDFVSPMAIQEPAGTNIHRWKLLGQTKIAFVQATEGTADLRSDIDPEANIASVTTEHQGQLTAYALQLFWGRGEGESQVVRGTVLNADWRIEIFPLLLTADPEEVPTRETFDAAASKARVVHAETLTLQFGTGGPEAANLIERGVGSIGSDSFGLRATTTIEMPPGTWEFITRSDDGVRVYLDKDLLIDRWTRHGVLTDRAVVKVEAKREALITIDYFEAAGRAELDFRIRSVPAAE